MKHYLFLFVALTCTVTFQTQAQSNQYLHFDGENDYIAVDEGVQYIANINAMSMTGWFNPDDLQYGAGMMGVRGNGTGAGGFYILQLNGGTLECRLLTNTGLHEVVGPAGTLVAQQWQHVALVYDGSTLELFVDGVSIGSSNASGMIESIDKPFAVGKSLEGGFNFVYPGKADEVTLWSKALSASEINDMMTNELVGDEADLQLYYKFDHGFPDEDNTSFSTVSSETGMGDKDATIHNMALVGSTSNFGGTLEPGVQAIGFSQLANKTTLDADFELEAMATSGLDVSFEIVSGPATVSGTTVSLNDAPGTVVVKAKQTGNGTFNAADEVLNSFEVVDALLNTPNIDIRNPLAGDVYAPGLDPIELASIVDIEFDELFDVTGVYFKVDGVKIGIKDWGNKHYTGWWKPTSYGAHTFEVIAENNFGGSSSTTVDFNVTPNAADLNTDAFTNMWLDLSNFSEEVEAELPSYTGAFNQIDAILDIACPVGGCDPWDRVSSIEVKGHDGEWYEIIRYLTPYGVACNHAIDLTDFMSLLQGKVTFRGNLGTQGNGFLYSLNLDYTAGSPAQAYSTIDKLWSDTYDFGNMANLQPCEIYTFNYEPGVEASTLKLVSTGHGWGDNNTGNAAEFHNDTHHIWVGGVETFSQNNWNDCNPNPDNCSPQAGTWTFDRAGWCPGSIAQWFDYSMDAYITTNPTELKYIFDEAYVDLCHPSNPNCTSPATCPNCDDGFNPHLIVKSHLISFRNEPFNTDTTYQPTTGILNPPLANVVVQVYPNPSAGRFLVNLEQVKDVRSVKVYDVAGRQVGAQTNDLSQGIAAFDLSHLGRGVYVVKVALQDGFVSKKVVIE